jgi:hypothetical protein
VAKRNSQATDKVHLPPVERESAEEHGKHNHTHDYATTDAVLHESPILREFVADLLSGTHPRNSLGKRVGFGDALSNEHIDFLAKV